MDLLLDTQVIAWIGTADPRISPRFTTVLDDPASRFFVSAVTAWEFAELDRRNRFGAYLNLGVMLDRLEASVLDLPATVWRLVDSLPALHRDPVDRMLVAHAIEGDLTLVTADKTMRRYPVRTLW